MVSKYVVISKPIFRFIVTGIILGLLASIFGIVSLIMGSLNTNIINSFSKKSHFLFGNCSYSVPNATCDTSVIYLCLEQRSLYKCNSSWFNFFTLSTASFGNSYSNVLLSFEQPACGDSLTITVRNTQWISNGMVIYIEGGGYYIVLSVLDVTSLIISNPCFVNNVLPRTIVLSNSFVSPAGSAGPSGSEGSTGSTGSMGSSGSVGSTGATGQMGETGATGGLGSTGTTGAFGSTGATGSSGSAGSTGENGSTGSTGSTGAQGSSGATGATGAIEGTGTTTTETSTTSTQTTTFTTTETSTTTLTTTPAPTTVPVLNSKQNGYYDVKTTSNNKKVGAGFAYGPATYDIGNRGNMIRTTLGAINGLISQFNATDGAEWARIANSPIISAFQGVAVSDIDGSVYAVGYARGSTVNDFGFGITVSGPNTEDNILIVKYDSMGITQWGRTIVSGSGRCIYTDVVVGADGSVYAVGYLYGILPYDFGNGVVAQSNYTDMGASGLSALIVKYDSSGAALWARTAGGSQMLSSQFNAVSIDSNGFIYAVGQFFNFSPLTNGTHFLNNNVVLSFFNVQNCGSGLVKYDSSGNTIFAVSHQTPSNVAYLSVFLDLDAGADGYIYVSGYIGSGSIPYDFGNGVVVVNPSASSVQVLAMRFNSSGTAFWAKSLFSNPGFPSQDVSTAFYGISLGFDGSVYAIGDAVGGINRQFSANVSILTSGSANNGITVKYEAATGTAQWGRQIPVNNALSNIQNRGIAAHSDGGIYGAGFATGSNLNPLVGFSGPITPVDQGDAVPIGELAFLIRHLFKQTSN